MTATRKVSVKSLGVTRARELRRNQTDAESKLSWRLRNRQIDGVKFRRQERMGPFIVDFCSIDLKLVIELDGGHHAEREAEDAKRTEFLQRSGYRVIRFWNNDVLQVTDGVVERIAEEIRVVREPGA